MKSLHVIWILLLLSATSFSQKASSVDYRVGEKEYQGYYTDAGKGAPFILLIHDWDGLNEYEIKRADMLAKLGYSVFALDLFGKNDRPKNTDDNKRLTGELYADRAKMQTLMRGSLEEARKKGATIENGVAIGYCFGGAAVLELARSGEQLKGFVAFHGGLDLPEGQDYNKIKGKILVLHGSADKSVSMEQFAELAKGLEVAKVDHEMISYSGAEHAFTVFGGGRYQENADKKSWARFIEFLNETVDNKK